MKIVFLLTQSLDSPSGLGRYWPMAYELSEMGHTVTILATHHNLSEISKRRFINKGVDIWYVGQMHVRKLGSHKVYFGFLRLLWTVVISTLVLVYAALTIPADIYYLAKPHPMNGLAALVAHILRNKPVYLDCDDYEAASNYFSSAWQRKVVTLFENYLPRVATQVSVNTHFTKERLIAQGYPPSQITYLPNGVERQRFVQRRAGEVKRLRRRLELQGRKVILYLGSLSLSNHAVDLLLESFALLRCREPSAILLVVGGGEDFDELSRMSGWLGITSDVVFVGRVCPSQAPSYYRLAVVSVDPVRDDLASRGRFPLKILESFACGTPVVTGAVGDRVELLAHGGGLLVTPGSAQSLADALFVVLSNEELYAQLRSEALEVREAYYWDKLAQKFKHIFAQIKVN